jgi:hypothetical protein
MTKKEHWPPRRGLPGKKRFKKGRSLKWGETPFDDLNRAELLRLVQAYHSAMIAARSVMALSMGPSPSTFWGPEGSGGRAMAKANHLIALVGDGGGNEASEKIYRSFFRSADVLLFPFLKDDKWNDWGINAKGEMIAPFRGESEGFRRIKWADVCPQEAPR